MAASGLHYMVHVTWYLLSRNSQTGQTMERMVNVTDILDIITKDFFARKNNTPFDEAAIDPAGKQVQEVVSSIYTDDIYIYF